MWCVGALKHHQPSKSNVCLVHSIGYLSFTEMLENGRNRKTTRLERSISVNYTHFGEGNARPLNQQQNDQNGRLYALSRVGSGSCTMLRSVCDASECAYPENVTF